jgi:hypothetical protein
MVILRLRPSRTSVPRIAGVAENARKKGNGERNLLCDSIFHLQSIVSRHFIIQLTQGTEKSSGTRYWLEKDFSIVLHSMEYFVWLMGYNEWKLLLSIGSNLSTMSRRSLSSSFENFDTAMIA